MNERAVFAEIFRLGPVSRPELAADHRAVQADDLGRPGQPRAAPAWCARSASAPGPAGRSALLYEVRPRGRLGARRRHRPRLRPARPGRPGRRRSSPARRPVPGSPRPDGPARPAHPARRRPGRARPASPAPTSPWPSSAPRASTTRRPARCTSRRTCPAGTGPAPSTGSAGVAGRAFVVENDIDLAAVGEATYGLGRGVAHFVYVSIGTGTGMGIVIDGKLYRGSRGARRRDRLPADRRGRPAAGRPGTRAAAACSSRSPRPTASSRPPSGWAGRGAITAKEVFDAARAGDADRPARGGRARSTTWHGPGRR